MKIGVLVIKKNVFQNVYFLALSKNVSCGGGGGGGGGGENW